MQAHELRETERSVARVYANCDPSRVRDLTADIRRALTHDKVLHQPPSTLFCSAWHCRGRMLSGLSQLRALQVSRESELVYNEPRKLTAFAHHELEKQQKLKVLR